MLSRKRLRRSPQTDGHATVSGGAATRAIAAEAAGRKGEFANRLFFFENELILFFVYFPICLVTDWRRRRLSQGSREGIGNNMRIGRGRIKRARKFLRHRYALSKNTFISKTDLNLFYQ